MISRRALAVCSLFGTALTAVLAVIGQIDPDPQLDHAALTVSDFAVSDRGGVTDSAMVVFGLSAIALMAAMRCRAAGLLGLFGVAMMVAAIAPTDYGTELSTVGYVHRYASMVAFVTLPAAGLLISRARAVRWTALASTIFMLMMLVSAAFGDRYLIGLIERLLLVSELLVLATLGQATGAYRALVTLEE